MLLVWKQCILSRLKLGLHNSAHWQEFVFDDHLLQAWPSSRNQLALQQKSCNNPPTGTVVEPSSHHQGCWKQPGPLPFTWWLRHARVIFWFLYQLKGMFYCLVKPKAWVLLISWLFAAVIVFWCLFNTSGAHHANAGGLLMLLATAYSETSIGKNSLQSDTSPKMWNNPPIQLIESTQQLSLGDMAYHSQQSDYLIT